MPSLTCSMTEGEESVGAVDVVLVAGSPANLDGHVNMEQIEREQEHILVGHDYEKALRCIFVRLKLVVRAVDSRASAEEQ